MGKYLTLTYVCFVDSWLCRVSRLSDILTNYILIRAYSKHIRLNVNFYPPLIPQPSPIDNFFLHLGKTFSSRLVLERREFIVMYIRIVCKLIGEMNIRRVHTLVRLGNKRVVAHLKVIHLATKP